MRGRNYPLVLAVVASLFQFWATGCGGIGGSVLLPPSPQAISVSVSPSTANVLLGNTQQFTATVTGTSNTAATWKVNGVPGGNSTFGTISSAGLYTAPAKLPSPATANITATSQADSSKSGSASITITSDVAVTVTTTPPQTLSVPTNGTLQLAATITSAGKPDKAVTWAVNCIANGNAPFGTITAAGLYTAPASVPTPFT